MRLEWVAPFDFSSEAQVEMIENLIRRGVDGILASVNDDEEIHRVFRKALDQGIAVATFDGDSPGSGRLFHIGIDNFRAGFAIGEALVDVLSSRGLAQQELDTMIMTGLRRPSTMKSASAAFSRPPRAG